MAHEDDHLEALARATDLLLASTEPIELARRFLAHVLEAFRARAGVLRVATTADPLLVAEDIPTGLAADLAPQLLQELHATGRLHHAWPAGKLRDAPPGWRRILGVRAGHAELDTVLILAFTGSANPAETNTRLLQVMTRNASIALDNALLHGETRRQAERLAVQADEMDRIHHALEHHSREMERALAARSRFFTVMSHELRTPINAILGYNQLLLQGAYGPLSHSQAEAATRVRGSAEQLLMLVDDVLDLSKIDAGVIEVRWCETDLNSLVQSTAAAVEANARLKGLRFSVDCQPDLGPVRTDPDRVRQILLNLLANAIKFTHSGTVAVTVRREDTPRPTPGLALTMQPGAGGWVALRVQDTGIGIPADQLETVFGEFIQLAPPAHGRSQGAGLGLAISRRLAHLLHGELTVESQLGIATTFSLLLPCPAPLIESAVADG